LAELCNTITRQAIELESCSNPLRIQQVFWFKLKKMLLVLGLGFSMGNVIMGECFSLPGLVCLALGANPTSHFLVQAFSGN